MRPKRWSSLGMAAGLEAELWDRRPAKRPRFRVGTRVLYDGALYRSRRGTQATVRVVREAGFCPYVLEWEDGWRGIAEPEELSR